MAHCKACDYTYYRARGLGSDRGLKAEKLERPSPQKYELFAIPKQTIALERENAILIRALDFPCNACILFHKWGRSVFAC